jgi:hypothetical protein
MYWVTVLPLLQSEKRTSLITKKIMLVALNYYKSIDNFLANSQDYSAAKFIGDHETKEFCTENYTTATPCIDSNNIMSIDIHSPRNSAPKLLNTTSDTFISEYYGKTLTSKRYKELIDAYAFFL